VHTTQTTSSQQVIPIPAVVALIVFVTMLTIQLHCL
jgi:hypothetical protein